MANLAKILEEAFKVARAVGPLAGVSGGKAAADAVKNLLKTLKGIADPVDKTKLQQELDKLQTEVNKQVDDAMKKLRGSGGGT